MLTVPWRLTVRSTDKPSLICSQRSGLTRSGTGGNSGKVGKAVRGGRVPQLSRLQGSLVVVVLLELLGHGSHLFEGTGAMESQTFGLIAAVIALNEAVLLGM